MLLRARLATPRDASSLAGIYNQAIEDRTATFETDLRTDDEVVAWFDGMHPIVVVESADAGGIIAFARTSAYSTRACYSGIFEFGVYTDPNHRRRGAGRPTDAAAGRPRAERRRKRGRRRASQSCPPSRR